MAFQTLCSYTLEHYGVNERKNRHLLEVTRALLIEMSVPKSFWLDGVLTTFLINRMPSKLVEGKSPVEVLCPADFIPVHPKGALVSSTLENKSEINWIQRKQSAYL